MKKLLWTILVISFMASSAFAQSNKIVFGPLVGDEAGILTVHNDQAIGIELWVRTDPGNPGPVTSICHGLLSENMIISERNGMIIEPQYDEPNWGLVSIEGPFAHDPDDPFPIPEGWTCEMQYALPCDFVPCDTDEMDTHGEWDLYGTWLMVTNTGIPIEQTYYPFAMGWYPHSGQGTSWSFEAPPGGSVIPEQDYCGLYFEQNPCEYIPGDCDHNGISLELSDVITMIGTYRGTVPVPFICPCPPHDDDFAATADPNGNCVANELNDVITELTAYRGLAEASGCPDCPGSEGLSNEERSNIDNKLIRK